MTQCIDTTWRSVQTGPALALLMALYMTRASQARNESDFAAYRMHHSRIMKQYTDHMHTCHACAEFIIQTDPDAGLHHQDGCMHGAYLAMQLADLMVAACDASGARYKRITNDARHKLQHWISHTLNCAHCHSLVTHSMVERGS